MLHWGTQNVIFYFFYAALNVGKSGFLDSKEKNFYEILPEMTLVLTKKKKTLILSSIHLLY